MNELERVIGVYYSTKIKNLEETVNVAYTERNRLVKFLTCLYPAGIAKTNIPGWADEWNSCVYIDTPVGQMSWHYHDRDKHLFEHLPAYEKPYDGHTTEGKYEALEKLGLIEYTKELYCE